MCHVLLRYLEVIAAWEELLALVLLLKGKRKLAVNTMLLTGKFWSIWQHKAMVKMELSVWNCLLLQWDSPCCVIYISFLYPGTGYYPFYIILSVSGKQSSTEINFPCKRRHDFFRIWVWGSYWMVWGRNYFWAFPLTCPFWCFVFFFVMKLAWG